jgi:membrane protease YdiL (CAAX protease family)
MSSIDPLPGPHEPDSREQVTPKAPWAAPPGSPLDRPPTDGSPVTDRPAPGVRDAAMYPDRYDDQPQPSVAQPPPRKPHPHIGWAILWMIGFMIVTQGAGLVITAVLLVIQIFAAPNRDELTHMGAKELTNSPDFARMMWPGMLITEVITILAAFAALRIIGGPAWARKVALRLPSFPHLLLVLLVLPAFVLIGQGSDEIAKVVDQYLRDTVWDYTRLFGNLDDTMAMIGYWPWWLGVLIIGVGPGIGEELFCRAYLGRGLVANHGVVFGVLLASVLFGMMHIIPRQVMYASVMGVALHTVYLTTRSLLMPMLLHTLNNGLGVLAAWWAKSHIEPGVNGAGLVGGGPMGGWTEKSEWLVKVDLVSHNSLAYAGAALLLLTVMVALYLSRARLTGADGGPPVWQPAYPTVEYPPAGSETVVSRPLGAGLVALAMGLLGMLAFVVCCYAAYLRS